MSVLSIPQPLAHVRVPGNFRTSALARFQGCRLKLVAASSETDGFLHAGPEAALGSLIHRVAELWGKGEGIDPQSLFHQVAEESRIRLAQDPHTAHFADLATTMAHGAWLDARASAASKCRPRHDQTLQASTVPRGPSFGFEKPLSSAGLRLSGKVDRIIRTGTTAFTIKDYKTGRIYDDDGAIKDDIAFQLRLYGLLFLDSNPGSHVTLVVVSGEEHLVSFTERDRADAMARLLAITSPLLPQTDVSAVAIAEPGPSCMHCKVRPLCPAYRRTAPNWWLSHPTDLSRIPADAWGTVIESKIVGGLLTLKIHDQSHRTVKISGLSDRHGIRTAVGTPLWFFNLVATGTGRSWNGQPFHPHAFHEMPRDRGERRAWTLRAFEGDA